MSNVQEVVFDAASSTLVVKDVNGSTICTIGVDERGSYVMTSKNAKVIV